jgi:RNA polymerase sigma factor (sigma-70 family)
MPTNVLSKTLNRLRQVLTVNDLTDSELLNRFLADRDENAFAVLVRRHGPLVMGVARRSLGNVHDAEDVFQATFLFLAQKAGSVINRQALPGWLYTVAYRTALAARARIHRRRKKEQQVEDMPHPEMRAPEVQDWQILLDAELNRLPEKYRLPVILCDLESRPRKEVCRQLRLAEGTLSSRLSTARRKLAERLTRRGITLSAGALATAMSEAGASAALPPGLVGSTAKTAVLVAAGKLTAVSSSVLFLMKVGARAMFLAKLKATLAAVVVLAFVGGGIVYSGGDSTQPKSELEALRRENELLKVNLRATLERIETLEKRLAASKERPRARARDEDKKRLRDKEMNLRYDADKLNKLDAELLKRLEDVQAATNDKTLRLQEFLSNDLLSKHQELLSRDERERRLEDAIMVLQKLVELQPANRDMRRALDAVKALRSKTRPADSPKRPETKPVDSPKRP